MEAAVQCDQTTRPHRLSAPDDFHAGIRVVREGSREPRITGNEREDRPGDVECTNLDCRKVGQKQAISVLQETDGLFGA